MIRQRFISIALIILLSACNAAPDLRVSKNSVSHQMAFHQQIIAEKKIEKPEKQVVFYEVRKGETLFSIAREHGKKYQELADINHIKAPFAIHSGQKLRIRACQKNEKMPSICSLQSDKKASVPVSRYVAIQNNDKLNQKKDSNVLKKKVKMLWVWPSNGKIIKGFSVGGPLADTNKGLDFEGHAGDPVSAAAAGRVVYSGRGLVGYGALVIIKHEDSLLSAYAHNRQLFVHEGDIVKAGQKIAEIGSVGASTPKLHFEIRESGQPVDPLQFLPAR